VRVEETLANAVGILFSVGVAVVCAVVSGPPPDGAFNGTSPDGGKEDLQGKRGGVRGVRPESVVPSSDAETCAEVVDDGPHGGLPKERSPDGLDEAEGRDAKDEEDVEPVDMLVPVFLGDGLVGDVRLLGVVLWVPVGL